MKILLCWGYHRKGWITPFLALENEFEFIYLFYKKKDEETVSFTNCNKIYWDNYHSARDILDAVKPDKIVFMSITSGYSIALNIAAKQRKITTYILQHGLFRTYKEYREIEIGDKKSKTNKENITVASSRGGGGTVQTLKFLLSSITFLDFFTLPKILYYFFLQKKEGLYFALKKIKFNQRKPKHYICYTDRNAQIHRELDDAGEKEILYIGMPELDSFFEDNIKENTTVSEKYFLLIDQPFADNQYYNLSVTKEQTNQTYLKLAKFCSLNNTKLYIKLHPESYQSDWLVQNDTIRYIKDTNIVPLIKNAKGVFGTTSTLMIPSVYLRPVFLLLIHNSIFQKRVIELGLAKGADYFNFNITDIHFITEKKPVSLHKFEQEYLYVADNKSVDRLANILRLKDYEKYI